MMKFVVGFALACVLCMSTSSNADTVANVGALYDAFRDIGDQIGIFPGNDDIASRLVIYNQYDDSCVDVSAREDGVGFHPRKLTSNPCAWDHEVRSQHFRLQHQDAGKLSIVTKFDDCIGFGDDVEGDTYTADWCDQSTHQFLLEVDEFGVGFRLDYDRTTCIFAIFDYFFHEICTGFATSNFLLCSLDGELCWPQNREEALQNRTEPARPDPRLTHSTLKKALKMNR